MRKRIAWMLVFALLFSLTACQRKPSGSEINMKSSTVPIDTVEATEATAEDATAKDATEEATQRQTTADQKGPTEPETEADTAKPTGNTAGNAQNENTGDKTDGKTGGKTDPAHQHSFQTTTVAATCNEQGYTKHTCSCGYSYTDGYTAKLGHHFVDEVVAPTSSEQGYTKHTCDRCWYSYKDTYTDPIKVVYDIEAAMAAGNAYALSIGFYTINYNLTPGNAGYYPCETVTGEIIAMLGGQSWLEQEMIAGAQATANNLDGTLGRDGHNCSFRSYIIYDSVTDTYTLYDLYN